MRYRRFSLLVAALSLSPASGCKSRESRSDVQGTQRPSDRGAAGQPDQATIQLIGGAKYSFGTSLDFGPDGHSLIVGEVFPGTPAANAQRLTAGPSSPQISRSHRPLRQGERVSHFAVFAPGYRPLLEGVATQEHLYDMLAQGQRPTGDGVLRLASSPGRIAGSLRAYADRAPGSALMLVLVMSPPAGNASAPLDVVLVDLTPLP